MNLEYDLSKSLIPAGRSTRNCRCVFIILLYLYFVCFCGYSPADVQFTQRIFQLVGQRISIHLFLPPFVRLSLSALWPLQAWIGALTQGYICYSALRKTTSHIRTLDHPCLRLIIYKYVLPFFPTNQISAYDDHRLSKLMCTFSVIVSSPFLSFASAPRYSA